jgi:hypothetical protein
MKSCWISEPVNRPTFAQLYATMQQVIGDLDSAGDVDYSAVYLTVIMISIQNSTHLILATCLHERGTEQ